jgi:CHAT domain-containing protein
VVQILNALYRRDYRIVHIAAHGHYDADPTRSGVLIGPKTFLSALEIAKMRSTPDLVFLNCCHVGALGPAAGPDPQSGGRPIRRRRRRRDIARNSGNNAPIHPNRLASSISRQLVENGVQAVVAAGWAVDDAAAATFADVFYRQLLDGYDLGRAARDARVDVHTKFGSRTNTWGAYQVWGQPAFRLAMGQVLAATAPAKPIARREFRDAVNSLKRRAAGAPSAAIDGLTKELAHRIAPDPDRRHLGVPRAVRAGRGVL